MSDMFAYQLSNTSQNLLLFLSVAMAVGMAIYCIKRQQKRQVIILLIAIFTFLLCYLSIFEFWVFGTGTIWPYGFFPGPHNKLEPVIRGFPAYNTVYFLLSTLSTSLLIFSIITLVNVVQQRVFSDKKWVKNRLRIPILNMWFIALELFRLLKSSKIHQAFVIPWLFFAAFWLYYKFLAGGVLRLGWDTYAIFDFTFFREAFQSRLLETYKTLSTNVEIEKTVTYYHYLSNMLVSFLTFFAGIFTAGMVHGIRWMGRKKPDAYF